MTAYTDELQISYIRGKEDALREKSLQDMQIAEDAYNEQWRDQVDWGPKDPEPGEPVFGTEEGGQGFFEFVKSLQISPKDIQMALEMWPNLKPLGINIPKDKKDPTAYDNPYGENPTPGNPKWSWAPVDNRAPEEPHNFYPFPNFPPEKLHDIEGTDLTNVARLHNSNTAGDTEYWGAVRNHPNYKSLPSDEVLQKNIQKLRQVIQTSMTPEAQRSLLIQGVKTFKEGGGEALRDLLKPNTVPDQFGHQTGSFRT